MRWFYSENSQPTGPVSDEALAELALKGTVTKDTPVWREGFTEWQPYHSVKLDIAPAMPTGLTAVCAECKASFPVDEMITYENLHVCANCKMVFFQKIKEGAPVHANLNYSTFGNRFVAKLCDSLVSGVINVVLDMIVGLGAGMVFGEKSLIPAIIIIPFNLAFAIFYNVWFVGKFGATPGKMALGLRIVRPDGSALTYKRAGGRFLGEMVTAFTFGIGYLMVISDAEKRALHDRIADTRVIKIR